MDRESPLHSDFLIFSFGEKSGFWFCKKSLDFRGGDPYIYCIYIFFICIMIYVLGVQSPITEENKHWLTENGLPRDLNIFYSLHPQDFESETLWHKHVIFWILAVLSLALIVFPDGLAQVFAMIGQELPAVLSDLLIRIIAAVLLLVIGFLWFSADTTVWKNIKTGWILEQHLIFHRIDQGDYDDSQLIELFDSRNFEEIFDLDEDLDSPVYLMVDEDKQGQVLFIMLWAYDNYVPLPLTKIAVVSGAEYLAVKKMLPQSNA